jgi:hypothetical protein
LAGLNQRVFSEGSAESAFGSSAGTRYDSVAHAPRSISLQRSEQNGLKRLSGFHPTGAPQVGHATMRGLVIGFRDYRS